MVLKIKNQDSKFSKRKKETIKRFNKRNKFKSKKDNLTF